MRRDRVTLKELETWLGTTETARIIGRSRPVTHDIANRGEIRAVKTRIGWLYDPESVEAYRTKQTTGGSNP